jgi:inosine triphosphate pyrophosphatase
MSAAAESSSATPSSLPRITLVTGNAGKAREVQQILDGIAIVDNIAVDLPELQGKSSIIIAKEKAKEAFRRLKRPCLIDDTGLHCPALGGLPGPYVKWFVENSMGLAGLHKMLVGFDDFSVSAVCYFVYATSEDDADIRVFEGKVDGKVVLPRGTQGFGWDPIFEESASGKTFAEMNAEEKNTCSHRKRALAALQSFLKTTAEQQLGQKRPRDE